MATRRVYDVDTVPSSVPEVEYWTHAAQSLTKLSALYTSADTVENINRVNRLLLAWPSDDTVPTEGLSSVKEIHSKLDSGLKGIKSIADRDAKAIGEVIERLDILIALRKASEAIPPGSLPITMIPVIKTYEFVFVLLEEKRAKRPRGHSPQNPSTPAPPVAAPVTRGVSITVPPRNSVGPQQPIPFSREPKARREALAKQLPLQEGRKVAFHPPNSSKTADSANGGKDEEWILAVVTKCINQDKNRYEVQDPEPQEDGQPGQCYNTTLRAIIPLPDPNAPPDSAEHLNAYPEFTTGSTVMALYPDTSCFYRAEVIASPRELQGAGKAAMYKLKFEDDDDQEHHVSAQWVVEWPGGP